MGRVHGWGEWEGGDRGGLHAVGVAEACWCTPRVCMKLARLTACSPNAMVSRNNALQKRRWAVSASL